MRDYVSLGSAPYGEECAQVGEENYAQRAIKECKRFIQLIRSVFGPEPDGAKLSVKAFNHDFGTYYEVVCYFDEESPKAIEYAFKCEEHVPERWTE